jgi:deoxycytidylate deaminase
MILNAQVARVVYIGDYSDLAGLELLKQAGLEVAHMDPEDFKGKLEQQQ